MTRNQIAKKLQEIAQSHRQVRTAKVVRADYFLNNEIKDVSYPAVWFTMNGVEIREKSKIVNVIVTVADIIHHPENQNRVMEVQSDMERVADDMVAQINWGKQEWTLVRSTSYEFFEDSYEDELAGVTFQLQLEFPFVYDACDLPSDYELPNGNFVYINTNRFMTVVDFIVGTGQPMTDGATDYQNNLLTVPPFVFIGGQLLTYQTRTDRRYVSHNANTKTITVHNGGVLDGEHVFIII